MSKTGRHTRGTGVEALKFVTSSNPADLGWLAVRTAGPGGSGGNSWEGATGLAWEVTVKDYGGAVVVLRGRESRPPGEGRQRVKQGEDCDVRNTSVNTGVAHWPDPGSAWWAVRKMQIKLHRWRARTPLAGSMICTTWSLIRRLWCTPSSEWPPMSGRGHLGSTGSRWPRFGHNSGSARCATHLKTRTFQPMPVRQVMIHKASGKRHPANSPTASEEPTVPALA